MSGPYIRGVVSAALPAADYNANWTLAEQSTHNLGDYVISGLVPSIGTGLSVNVTLGRANIAGYDVNVTAGFVIASLAPNTTNYLYLKSDGTGTSNTTGTPPANSILLGTAATGPATVTSVSVLRSSGREVWVKPINEVHGAAGGPRGIDLTTWAAAAGDGVEAYGVLPAGAMTLTGAVILAPGSNTRNLIQPTGDFKPIVLRGFAGQTQPLWEGQDSFGTVVASLGPSGRLGLGAAFSATQRLSVILATPSNLGIVVKSAALQTGNLFETQDSAGVNTTFFRVLAGGIASGPHSGTNSERYGLGSVASGNLTTAIGNDAQALTDNSTAVGHASRAQGASGATALGYIAYALAGSCSAFGYNSNANTTNSTAFGANASAGTGANTAATALGSTASAPASSSIAIGASAQINSNASASIAIGNSVVIGSGHSEAIVFGLLAASSSNRQVVFGSANHQCNDFYLGKGVTNSAPLAVTVQATGGSGTDIGGANLILAAGKGTGAGTGGSIKLQSTIAGGSASTLRTLQDKWIMSNTGIWQAWQPSTAQDRQAYDLTVTWATATDASRKARGVFSIWDTAAREAFRIESNGSNPMIGFLGATAIVRPGSTTDLRQAMIDLGLYTTGGATPLDLNGGSLVASGAANSIGATTHTGDVTLSTKNIVTDTTTGTKIGTGTTQKLGFFNAAPVVQQVGASAAGIAAILDVNAKNAIQALQTALANLGFVTSPA